MLNPLFSFSSSQASVKWPVKSLSAMFFFGQTRSTFSSSIPILSQYLTRTFPVLFGTFKKLFPYFFSQTGQQDGPTVWSSAVRWPTKASKVRWLSSSSDSLDLSVFSLSMLTRCAITSSTFSSLDSRSLFVPFIWLCWEWFLLI